jgi:DNA-binding transcriptional ArsR family regulator
VSETELGPAGGAAWLQLIADPVRYEIVRTLALTGECTAAELAERGVLSKPTLRRHLDALVSVGVVDRHRSESDGQTPGRPPVRYSLAAEVRASMRAFFPGP